MSGPSSSSLDARGELAAVFRTEILASVHDLWFSHLGDESETGALARHLAPSKDKVIRWFIQSDEFDDACRTKFGPALDLIQKLAPTPSIILDAASLTTARDWVSLIILLDQIPRNIYRGPASSVVYNFFDPLALSVAKTALSRSHSITTAASCRLRFPWRVFVCMPLQHSESLSDQDRSLESDANGGLADTVRGLSDDGSYPDDDSEDGKLLRLHRSLMLDRRDEAAEFASIVLDSARKHRHLIARFGRFPHRNAVLGREPTEEEVRYLADGGETFGSKQ